MSQEINRLGDSIACSLNVVRGVLKARTRMLQNFYGFINTRKSPVEWVSDSEVHLNTVFSCLMYIESVIDCYIHFTCSTLNPVLA